LLLLKSFALLIFLQEKKRLERLTEAQWAWIEPLFPEPAARGQSWP
jgi:hypothetical protein